MRNGVDNVSMVRPNPDVSDFADAIKMAKENGNEGLYIADSIEELAEKAGIDVDNLVDTVEEYNDFCDSVDEEFFKDKRYLRPITKAPFYGARIRPGVSGGFVQIRVNWLREPTIPCGPTDSRSRPEQVTTDECPNPSVWFSP